MSITRSIWRIPRALITIWGTSRSSLGRTDPEAYRLHRKRFVGGAGTYPLIGTPQHIAEQLAAISQVGFAGVALAFVNYKDELPYFIETVLPLLREAGLRE